MIIFDTGFDNDMQDPSEIKSFELSISNAQIGLYYCKDDEFSSRMDYYEYFEQNNGSNLISFYMIYAKIIANKYEEIVNYIAKNQEQ